MAVNTRSHTSDEIENETTKKYRPIAHAIRNFFVENNNQPTKWSEIANMLKEQGHTLDKKNAQVKIVPNIARHGNPCILMLTSGDKRVIYLHSTDELSRTVNLQDYSGCTGHSGLRTVVGGKPSDFTAEQIIKCFENLEKNSEETQSTKRQVEPEVHVPQLVKRVKNNIELETVDKKHKRKEMEQLPDVQVTHPKKRRVTKEKVNVQNNDNKINKKPSPSNTVVRKEYSYRYFIVYVMGRLVKPFVVVNRFRGRLTKFLEDDKFYFATSFLDDLTKEQIKKCRIISHPDHGATAEQFRLVNKSLQFVESRVLTHDEIEDYLDIVFNFMTFRATTEDTKKSLKLL